jgi:hypothetical protein
MAFRLKVQHRVSPEAMQSTGQPIRCKNDSWVASIRSNTTERNGVNLSSEFVGQYHRGRRRGLYPLIHRLMFRPCCRSSKRLSFVADFVDIKPTLVEASLKRKALFPVGSTHTSVDAPSRPSSRLRSLWTRYRERCFQLWFPKADRSSFRRISSV